MRRLLIVAAGAGAMLAIPAPAWAQHYDGDRWQAWDSRSDVDRDAYDRGYDDGWRDAVEDGRGDAEMPPPPPPPAPPPAGMRYPDVAVTRGGVPVAGARVTTTCVGGCGGTMDGGWFYPPTTETIVTIPGSQRVVTTTTTHPATSYVVERPGKTVRKVQRKTIRRK